MPFPHLLLILTVISIWGFNFVVIKTSLDTIPPLFLCALRFILTSLPALLFVRRPDAPFRMVALYGLLMFVLQFAFLFCGIYLGVSAGLASIVLQFQAFFALLMAVLLLGERINIWTMIGALVSFSGIGLVIGNLDAGTTGVGLILVLSAAAFWGAGSVIVKKMGKVNMISLVVWGALIAWPPLLLSSLFIEYDDVISLIQNFTWIEVGSVFFITYMSTIFAFCAWNWLLQRHPVSAVSPFTLLVPIIAMFSASYFLGEPLQPWKISAAALVISGLCINLAGPKVRRAFQPAKE